MNKLVLPKISSAMFVLTHRCSLHCRYCWLTQEACDMSFEVALDATKFLIRNAEETEVVPHINYFGGEPTLMWDSVIVPLTTWIRQEYRRPFTLGITTNGTLLNDERIAFLKKNQVGVLFSIDGDKETQDYNRPYVDGRGSFDSLQDIIPKIPKAFREVTFRGTVIPPTCQHTFHNIMFAEKNGYKNFYIVPNVFEEWSETDKNVLKSEFEKYVDYYIESYRSGRTPIEFTPFKDAFRDIKKINYAVVNQQHRTLNQCHSCGKCGLGANRNASIHPNGNVFGCQEMSSNAGVDNIFYIGNIYTGIDDDRRLALMNQFDAEPAIGDDCGACKYNRICNGGCVANNYLITGYLHKNPPMYCWWQRIVLDAAIRIMQTLGNEGNVAFRERWRLLT